MHTPSKRPKYSNASTPVISPGKTDEDNPFSKYNGYSKPVINSNASTPVISPGKTDEDNPFSKYNAYSNQVVDEDAPTPVISPYNSKSHKKSHKKSHSKFLKKPEDYLKKRLLIIKNKFDERSNNLRDDFDFENNKHKNHTGGRKRSTTQKRKQNNKKKSKKQKKRGSWSGGHSYNSEEEMIEELKEKEKYDKWSKQNYGLKYGMKHNYIPGYTFKHKDIDGVTVDVIRKGFYDKETIPIFEEVTEEPGPNVETYKRAMNELKKNGQQFRWQKSGELFGVKSHINIPGKTKCFYNLYEDSVIVTDVSKEYNSTPGIDIVALFDENPYYSNLKEPEDPNFRKSEQEIIDEVKSKGRYNYWVEDIGSLFGYKSDEPYIPGRDNRIYRDVNGMSNVSKREAGLFDPSENNFAAFEKTGAIYDKFDPYRVTQNEYKIVYTNEKLWTAGLGPCTALAMVIGNKKLMAHVDGDYWVYGQPFKNTIHSLISSINDLIKSTETPLDKIFPEITPGFLGNVGGEKSSVNAAKKICRDVNIPEKNWKINESVESEEIVWF